MTDLLANIKESQDERQAIQMADGITTSTAELHRCEVLSIVNRYFPEDYTQQTAEIAGKNVERFCEMIGKARGQAAADKVLADCRAEWKKRKEAA